MRIIVGKKGGKKWVQKAIDKPGSLRKEMGAAEGKPIPKGKINSEISRLRKKRESGKTLSPAESKKLKRLNLAKTLGKMRKKKKASPEIMETILRLADELDELGLDKEATILDNVLKILVAQNAAPAAGGTAVPAGNAPTAPTAGVTPPSTNTPSTVGATGQANTPSKANTPCPSCGKPLEQTTIGPSSKVGVECKRCGYRSF